MDYISVGKQIRKIRDSKKISQERLAEMTEYSTKHIGNIETGKSIGSLKAIVKIANALEVGIDELLCHSVDQGKSYIVKDLALEIEGFTNDEYRIILEYVKSIKNILRNPSGKSK